MSFKIGDKVKIKTREATAEEFEDKTYYNFFGGLTGVVAKDAIDGSYVINIDRESLPSNFLARHKEIEKLEKERWLSGLSEENRRSLTAEQKQYHLDYKLLVKESDLELFEG